MLVWSKFITWSYWTLILFHIDPNQERNYFFAWERSSQTHGKLQPILNLSYFSKQTNIKTSTTSERNEIYGEKMYLFLMATNSFLQPQWTQFLPRLTMALLQSLPSNQECFWAPSASKDLWGHFAPPSSSLFASWHLGMTRHLLLP